MELGKPTSGSAAFDAMAQLPPAQGSALLVGALDQLGAGKVAPAAQVELLAMPDDIVIAFGAAADAADAASVVQAARVRGCLTIAFARVGADWEFEPPTGDRYVAQELVETLYHVLWELTREILDAR